MVALVVSDVKDFMTKLLTKGTFDSFELVEASLVTHNSFYIDGRLQKGYYTTEEWEESYNGHVFSKWEMLRPVCFNLIKGKKIPLSFRIVFRLADEKMSKVLEESGLPYRREDVAGLYFNVRYEKNKVSCTTGTAFQTFILDKSLELYWDVTMRRFLMQAEITATEND
jgi:hypothetical protein